jgi:hypothetical protein
VSTTNNDHHGQASSGESNGSAYASASSVAGVARDIEALRCSIETLSVEELRRLPGRVDELAGLLARLADTVNPTSAPGAGGVVSWLDLPADLDTTYAVLGQLLAWMQVVYLRYPDAAASLPDCWLWHPDVVEELLWLRHTWLAAYRDDNAPITAAADWHDRYRPGVIRRITATAGRCSLENHQPRDDHPLPGAGPVVPGAGAAEQIATWWATHRTDPPPEPDDWQLATASTRRRPGTRR